LALDDNPLINKEYRPVPGWSLPLFAIVATALCLPVMRFLPIRGLLPILSVFYVSGLGGVIAAAAPLGTSALPALGIRPVGWRPIVLGIVGTLVLSVAVSQLGLEPKAMKEAIDIAREPGELIKSLLVLGGLAPLVEELLFRGLLYGWIAGRWGTMPALVVSSLAFAFAHYEPAHILLVLPLGFLFGYLRRRTDSIFPSLCAHIVNNSFAVVAAAYFGS
jgi:hypothetical protein